VLNVLVPLCLFIACTCVSAIGADSYLLPRKNFISFAFYTFKLSISVHHFITQYQWWQSTSRQVLVDESRCIKSAVLLIQVRRAVLKFRNFVTRRTKFFFQLIRSKKKLQGLSPRANYTDRATGACRRSDCQLLRIEGATWSA
jgi:hypothetical protein